MVQEKVVFTLKHKLIVNLDRRFDFQVHVVYSYLCGVHCREKMELLFNALKRDLLNPENSMEDIFSLLTELKTAAEKNFTLKKLFWKVSDQCILGLGRYCTYPIRYISRCM